MVETRLIGPAHRRRGADAQDCGWPYVAICVRLRCVTRFKWCKRCW